MVDIFVEKCGKSVKFESVSVVNSSLERRNVYVIRKGV